MSNLSVVIPSRSLDNLLPCIFALRKHEPDVQVLVIWDGPKNTEELRRVQHVVNTEDQNRGCCVLGGKQPFIFARNANIGIHAARHDVVLLNDDALLETPGGFSLMQRSAMEHPEYGLISATTNLAGNPAQMRMKGAALRPCPSPTPGNSFATVAFICVLIPARTRMALASAMNLHGRFTNGLLDERFAAYGWEDNDYCRQIDRIGLKIGIHDGCFVDHCKLKSTFRGNAYAAGDINAGRKIYLDKWGKM